MKVDLNGKWLLKSDKYKDIAVNVPGSVLGALLENGLVDEYGFLDAEQIPFKERKNTARRQSQNVTYKENGKFR